ncbi:uncharacterized protein CEXT_358301 [Caerostris extrusa]|uniref:Uncharacterized protein n=1 Tax=Caerostris extrusa TaxID=172846 RepID=A0AAV4SF68_CAEEX|nr:uncharacterized protein CEXT_358301 [Caerostris extrusa]
MQPVLNEVRYMFPVTQLEIEGMCKVWSHIMDCVRKYVVDCSSEEQRTKFNEAVSNSIDSVHAICSSERYRKVPTGSMKKCVSDPIQRMCGPQALYILDDSMSSLKSRCEVIEKPSDKICPADTPAQDIEEFQQPKPALRHVEQTQSPMATSGYLLNTRPIPYTTPAWTPRTVIYPYL